MRRKLAFHLLSHHAMNITNSITMLPAVGYDISIFTKKMFLNCPLHKEQ